MNKSLDDLIKYRIERAFETLADARILADNSRGTRVLIDYIMLLSIA